MSHLLSVLAIFMAPSYYFVFVHSTPHGIGGLFREEFLRFSLASLVPLIAAPLRKSWPTPPTDLLVASTARPSTTSGDEKVSSTGPVIRPLDPLPLLMPFGMLLLALLLLLLLGGGRGSTDEPLWFREPIREPFLEEPFPKSLTTEPFPELFPEPFPEPRTVLGVRVTSTACGEGVMAALLWL